MRVLDFHGDTNVSTIAGPGIDRNGDVKDRNTPGQAARQELAASRANWDRLVELQG
jgi:hypothetical protein